jgi:ribosomal protein L37AE/L43A
MLWVRGKRFTCECGANVFTQQANGIYRCNGCTAEYEGA